MSGAGLPDGVLQVVTGQGSVLGEALVTDPRVAKVAFTGSTAVGKHVAELAARGVKRVTLELGGSDPMIVLADADIDAAVSAASVGRFFNCGQACLAVKRLYLHEQIADEFVEKLRTKVAKLKLGDGTAEGTMLGPLHSESQRETLEQQVAATLEQGGELLAGGKRPDAEELAHGWFYEPTLVLEPPHDSALAVEEVFGPALPIWRIGDIDEGIRRANSSEYGLGSSIWTRDLSAATKAAEKLEAGYTWINSGQIVYDEPHSAASASPAWERSTATRRSTTTRSRRQWSSRHPARERAHVRRPRARLPFRDSAAHGHRGRHHRVLRSLGRLQSAPHRRDLRGGTPYGERIAHGALVISVATGLRQRLGLFDGTLLGLLEIRSWKFTAPVRIGDTIRVVNEVIEKRETSNPTRGVVVQRVDVVNQHDDVVQSGEFVLMVARR